MTKTYTEVQENSVRNFRSRHLISSGRRRLSCLAKEKLRRSRYSSKPPTERYDTLSENVRQCHLWECIGTQGRSRLRKIWKLGYFGSQTTQNTFILEVNPPLLADVRRVGKELIIEYSQPRRIRNIDSIAIKNREEKYCHLERY